MNQFNNFPGIKGIPYQFIVKFENKWFYENDILLYSELGRNMKVLSNPRRKWYEVLFQYLTFGIYKAGYYYKVQII